METKDRPTFKALLLDLDDTLLVNPMEAFIPAYFKALSESLSSVIAPDRLISALMSGMRAMSSNDGSGPTNRDAFAGVFYGAAGVSADVLDTMFEAFYVKTFPELRALTRPAPSARAFVSWAIRAFPQIVIATNPVFPQTAVDQRLTWAEVPPSEFEFALITTLDNMHAVKPHPAYYREILDILDRRPGECLMAGDDWERDIEPAAALGVAAFWVAADGIPLPDPNLSLFGRGDLQDLWSALRQQ